MKSDNKISIKTSLLLLFLVAVFTVKGQVPVTSEFIVVDQFGYRPAGKKIAVIRNPQVGFDSEKTFTPGSSYALVKVSDSTRVFTAEPSVWGGGATDESSGDKAWWFDFSSVTEEGAYFVLDIDSNLCSYEFEISENVYEEVLKQAVRTFFYQRVGFAKQPPFACEEWADEASHLQDKNARDFLAKNNASTERDVSGGWYDAGDFNKYTNWNANYIVLFMHAFLQSPGAWGDDYNIPESGNAIPDILDEAKWGIDHLLRMQNPDGSVLSIVGEAHASPPSKATGPSYYGRASTSATLNTAGAFALASKVYRSIGMATYADSLKNCAIKAWEWADKNPNVIFRNNEGSTSGLGAGQQETNDYGRLIAKLEAATFLYEITSEPEYKTYFENHYTEVHLMQWNYAYPFEKANQEILLYYAGLPGVSSGVASNIRSKYKNAMENGEHNFVAFFGNRDPYLAHLKDYTWGSNGVKSGKGLMFTDYVNYGVNASKNNEALEAAEDYIHYLHGVNPLNMVYLSNMYNFGAENGVNEFYHSWFTNGSARWDRVGESLYGPAPGFLTGGPNPSYDWDGCCPSGCGSSGNNAKCYGEEITPPKDQPKQKSYKDFNTSWPLNSWSVTENSCGYQLRYIRLLSQFVATGYDCAGVYNGTASYDVCGVCSGGSTGITPVSDPTQCGITAAKKLKNISPQVYPNPATDRLFIDFNSPGEYVIEVLNSQGQKMITEESNGNLSLNISKLPQGTYFVLITNHSTTFKERFTKL